MEARPNTPEPPLVHEDPKGRPVFSPCKDICLLASVQGSSPTLWLLKEKEEPRRRKAESRLVIASAYGFPLGSLVGPRYPQVIPGMNDAAVIDFMLRIWKTVKLSYLELMV